MRNVFTFIFSLLFIFSTSSQIFKTIDISTPGTLSTSLTTSEKNTITSITITGVLDARDFKCLRNEMVSLTEIVIPTVTIQSYTGYAGTYPASWGSTSYLANELPKFAFRDMDTEFSKNSLTNILLPSSITSIGEYAFHGCTGLDSIVFPPNVVSIKNSAFYQCHGLSEVNLPNSVTSLGSYTFQEIENLTQVTLGTNLNTIGFQCFYNCPNLRTVYSNNATPPSLSGNPFALSYINIVYVPSSSVSSYRYATYWKDFNIGINEVVTVHNSVAGELKNLVIALGKDISAITDIIITGFLNSTDIKFLKDELSVLTQLDISGTTVTKNLIPNNAFNGKNSLVSVKLPETITSIGDYAFNSCTNITGSAPLPASLISIGKFAFNGCSKMTGSLHFPPNLTVIREKAFYNCSSLSGTITFPPTLTTIESSAFYGCSSLSGQLILPNSITTLGTYAFQNCHSLSGTLILPNGLTQIAYGTFFNCSSLSGALNIPSSVQQIEGTAFSGCESLSEINLGGNVTGIGDEAFFKCYDINKISVPISSPPSIYTNTFRYVDKANTLLQVPFGATSAYTSHNLWNAFTNIVEVGETYNLKVIAGGNGVVMANGTAVNSGDVLAVNKNSTKTFTLTPNPGYIVYSLLFNEENVVEQLTGNQYTTPLITDSSTLIVSFEMAHTISVNIDNQLGGTVTQNGIELSDGDSFVVIDGEYSTFTIIPDEGYFVDSVTFDGNNISLPLTDNQFTTAAITGNALLDVSFKKITYNVTLQLNVGGIVQQNNINLVNNSVINVDQNEEITFTIIPNEGFEIDSLFFDSQQVSLTDNQFQTAPIHADATLLVRFKASTTTYNIHLLVGNNGVVKENDVALANDTILESLINSTRTFQIVPDEGYEIDTVSFGGQNVTQNIVNGQFSTSLITADDTLSVTFKHLSYVITILKGDGGQVVVDNISHANNDTIHVEPGSVLSFTITPVSGFGIDKVLFNGVDVKSQLVDNVFTTDAINGHATLDVTFEKLVFTITLNKGTGGIVKESNIQLAHNSTLTANVNEVKTFTFTPDGGKTLTSLKYGNTNVLNQVVNNSYTTPPITSDAVLDVNFNAFNCYLYVEINGNGKINATGFLPTGGTSLVTYGSTTQFTIIPDLGYELDSLLYDGVNVKSNMVGNTYTTPTTNTEFSTLRIVFKKISFNIQVISNDGGSIDVYGIALPNDTSISVSSGEEVTFTINPNSGFLLDSLLYGDQNVTESLLNNEFTTPPVTNSGTLKVVFKKQNVSIKVQTGTEGKVKLQNLTLPNDTVLTVVHGDDLILSILPNYGYKVDSLLFGEIDVLDKLIENELRIDSLIKSDTIRVVFRKTKFDILIKSKSGGKIEFNNSIVDDNTLIPAEYGSQLSFLIIPDEGYELDSVCFSGADVKDKLIDDIFTTDSVVKADTLHVTFKKQVFDITILTNSGGTVKLGETILENEATTSVEYGLAIQFLITPSEGYELDSLYFSGVDVKEKLIDDVFTTDSVIKTDTLHVTFKKQTFEIKILTNLGGVVKLGNDTLQRDTVLTLEYGTRLQLLIKADEGYQIEKIIYNNESIVTSADSTIHVINSVLSDGTLEVIFKNATSTPLISNSMVRVYAIEAGIAIDGILVGDLIRVFTINGSQVANIQANSESMIIPLAENGIYLVLIKGSTFKVIR
ncbi:MAG: leucine-rich repeat domain-containing protein [Paludibacteraceae bacterium]